MLYLHEYSFILLTYIAQLYVSKVICALSAKLVGHTEVPLVLNLSTSISTFHMFILVFLIAAQLTIKTLN
jgi:low affinity Fe/Cu permease